MRFDVEELLNDWLVSGQKRGEFLAKVRMIVYSNKPPLSLELGWRNLHRVDYPRGSPPRRTTLTESLDHSPPYRR